MTGVFIESADIDISSGDSLAFVKKLIPDMAFVKEQGISNTPVMNIVLKRREFPGQSLVVDSTSQITETTTFKNLRTRSRQIVLRFESDDDAQVVNQKGYKWRVGATRLDLQPSGRRA
jgi:hypothetical protein